MKVFASEDHLHRLNQAAERFFEDKTDVVSIAGELNARRTKYLFRVEDVIEWPRDEWGVIIGDSVHCLRSALDHLVYGLSTDPSSQTQFPICRTEKEWVTKAPANYWSVPERIVAIIKNAQPYHRGDAANDHPLAVLGALSNFDKHRAIPTVALVPDNNQATVTRDQGIAKWAEIRFHKGRAYEKGAVIAECSIVLDDSGLEPEMNVHIESDFDIGFGAIKSAPWLNARPVIETFKDVLGAYIIDEIFNRVTLLYIADAEAAGGQPST